MGRRERAIYHFLHAIVAERVSVRQLFRVVFAYVSVTLKDVN